MSEQTISFTVEEINQILGALGKIPAEHSMNLILFIKQTAEKQLPPSEEAPVEVEVEAV
jgi:hypothetical protein